MGAPVTPEGGSFWRLVIYQIGIYIIKIPGYRNQSHPTQSTFDGKIIDRVETRNINERFENDIVTE
jgi:hypothetical protein